MYYIVYSNRDCRYMCIYSFSAAYISFTHPLSLFLRNRATGKPIAFKDMGVAERVTKRLNTGTDIQLRELGLSFH